MADFSLDANYTLTEANAYFGTNMPASPGWAKMSDQSKQMALNYAATRFCALPWRSAYGSMRDRRIPAIQGAFYAYVASITYGEFCAPAMPLAVIAPDQSTLLLTVCDLPRDVAARIIRYLNPDYLTPRFSRTLSDSRKAAPMAVRQDSATRGLNEAIDNYLAKR